MFNFYLFLLRSVIFPCDMKLIVEMYALLYLRLYANLVLLSCKVTFPKHRVFLYGLKGQTDEKWNLDG